MAAEFRQRNICMEFEVTSDIGQRALPSLVDHLCDSANTCACMFVNFVSECAKWAGTLETLLAKAGMKIGVLQINGAMDKHEKFSFIRLFTSAIRMSNFNPRVLVFTAAANTGIDNKRVDYVLRVGLPRCLITLLQERGRNARVAGMKGLFAVFTDWKLFMRLLMSIIAPNSSKPDEVQDHNFANSMISSKSPLRKMQAPNRGESNESRSPLTKKQIQQNMTTAYNDLIDVVHLYFLPGFGCVHCRCEWFLFSGEHIGHPEIMLLCG